MQKRNTALLVGLAAGMMLASCGGTPVDSSASSASQAASSTTSKTTTSASGTAPKSVSSSTPVEKYQVVIKAAEGITITPDKASAAKGETVTLSVAVAAGFTLGKVSLAYTDVNKSLTVTSGTTSFEMPDEDVIIKATSGVSGDVTLYGDIAVKLEKEGEIYVARNVKVENAATFNYKIQDTLLDYEKLDGKKCFGDIDFKNVKPTEVTPIVLAGNAYYDFYYDPAAERPCYIQRVGVISAPSTSDAYYSLFDGSVQSDPSTYPLGVNGVSFWDSQTNLAYDWTLYQNNTSFATIKTKGSVSDSAHVYKSIKDGYETVVDDYIEGAEDAAGDNYDTTRREDQTAFSGKYKVVDVVDDARKDWDKNAHDAEIDANSYSHDVYSLDFMQDEGYRTGFDATYNDTLKNFHRTITSVTNTDGTFTTTIASDKTFEPSTTDTTVTKHHETYDIVTTFTKAGAPLTGTYIEKTYGDNAWDFTNFVWKTGWEKLGTLVKQYSFAYTYGDPSTETPDFDATPYFATSITPVFTKNKAATTTVEAADVVSDMLGVEVAPTTALDAWQYGITASSDTNLIGIKEGTSNTWEARVDSEGKATVTISNHVTATPSAQVELTVTNTAPIHDFILYSGYTEDAHLLSADECWVKAGSSYTTGLYTSMGSGYTADSGSLSGITVAYTETKKDSSGNYPAMDGYLTTAIDTKNRKITFDASSAVSKMTTDKVTVRVVLYSPHFQSGWGPAELTVQIIKVDTKLNASYLSGTWHHELASDGTQSDATTVFNFTDTAATNATYAAAGYKKATLAVDGDNFSFDYFFDDNAGALLIHAFTHVDGTKYVCQYYKVATSLEWETNKIGFYIIGENIGSETTDGETSWTSETVGIMGSSVEDEEGNTTETDYYYFSKDVA